MPLESSIGWPSNFLPGIRKKRYKNKSPNPTGYYTLSELRDSSFKMSLRGTLHANVGSGCRSAAKGSAFHARQDATKNNGKTRNHLQKIIRLPLKLSSKENRLFTYMLEAYNYQASFFSFIFSEQHFKERFFVQIGLTQCISGLPLVGFTLLELL